MTEPMNDQAYRALLSADPAGASVLHYLETMISEYDEQMSYWAGRGDRAREAIAQGALTAYRDAVRVFTLASDRLYESDPTDEDYEVIRVSIPLCDEPSVPFA